MAVGYRQTHRASSATKTRRHHLVTSDRLYALGIELMDRAMADAFGFVEPSKAQAFAYRDGLIIALLALIPLRRRTVAALRIGKHVVKSGQLWALDIPAADSKTRRALDYPVFWKVPSDFAVAGTSNHGKPFAQGQPTTKIAQNLTGLGATLMGASSHSRGLLSRLLERD